MGSAWSNGDFEFVELANLQEARSISQDSPSPGNPVHFFRASSGVTSLAPGSWVLVVRNRTAFLERVSRRDRNRGQFTGALGNNGNRIRLLGPLREVIQDLAAIQVAPLTDGVGFSLVPSDESRRPGHRRQCSLPGRPVPVPADRRAPWMANAPPWLQSMSPKHLTPPTPPLLDSSGC